MRCSVHSYSLSCLMSRLRLHHARVGGRLGMFCPRLFRTSGSLGGLPLVLLCWLCIGGFVFCCLPCVCVLVGGLLVMLLAPLASLAVAYGFYISLVVCASPHFQLVAVAGGLFRTVSHTPFMSLGNAALATCPNSPSSKLSQVVRRASSTHVSVCDIPTECNPLCGLGCIQF